MVDYRENLEELTKHEKETILTRLDNAKRLSVSRETIIFLMREMNRMYGRTIYEEKDLSCSDCKNNILNFWKISSKKWSV